MFRFVFELPEEAQSSYIGKEGIFPGQLPMRMRPRREKIYYEANRE